MPLAHRETVESQGVEAALLDVGDGHVELLRPLGPDTPVGKYLEKRGPGLHHVAYAVDDIDDVLGKLKDAGRRADRLRSHEWGSATHVLRSCIRARPAGC